MKKIIILSAVLAIQLLSIAQSPDEEGIKKLVRAETESYFGRNLEAWKQTWHQSAQVRRTFVSKFGYATEVSWDTALAHVQAEFKQSPQKQAVDITTSNYNVVQKGDMALVSYDQVLTGPAYNPELKDGHTHETRVLVKEGTEWKIISQTTTSATSYDNTNPQMLEYDLNMAGYNLIAAKKLADAIEVFKLNVKLFPQAWNAYDSLGEAFALAGDKKKAIEHYEKSVKLNPKSESGPAALAKLKQK